MMPPPMLSPVHAATSPATINMRQSGSRSLRKIAAATPRRAAGASRLGPLS